MKKIDCTQLNAIEVSSTWKENIFNMPRIYLRGQRLTINQCAHVLVRSSLQISDLYMYFDNQNKNMNKSQLVQYILKTYIVEDKIRFRKQFMLNRINTYYTKNWVNYHGLLYYNNFVVNLIPSAQEWMKECNKLAQTFKFLNVIITIYNEKSKPIVSAWIKDGRAYYTTPVEPTDVFSEPPPDVNSRIEYEQLWPENISRISPTLQKYILTELNTLLRDCGATPKINTPEVEFNI